MWSVCVLILMHFRAFCGCYVSFMLEKIMSCWSSKFSISNGENIFNVLEWIKGSTSNSKWEKKKKNLPTHYVKSIE